MRVSSSEPSSSTTFSTAPSLTAIRPTAARKPQLAAVLLEPADQHLQDRLDAGQRPGEPFQEDRAEEDAELVEVDVVLLRAAVEQDRAEDHLDQQRIVDHVADDLPGRAAAAGAAELVVVDQLGHQAAEVVDLARESAGGFRLRATRSRWRTAASRRGTRSPSRAAAPAPIPPRRSAVGAAVGRSGPRARALGGEVGHGVQPDVEHPAALPVERVQPADGACGVRGCRPAGRSGPGGCRPPAPTCRRR